MVKSKYFSIFISIACYIAAIGVGDAGAAQWSAFILLQLYGLRLTSNFYRDWPGLKHEDWRYVCFTNLTLSNPD